MSSVPRAVRFEPAVLQISDAEEAERVAEELWRRERRLLS
jgi:hypothetical protein